jgi:hypothetical protein
MLCKGGDLLLAFVGNRWLSHRLIVLHICFFFFFFYRNIGIDLSCGRVTFFLLGSKGLLWIERRKRGCII